MVRAAGSGIEGSGDLLALRGDICFPIEVKSTNESKRINIRTVEQYNSLVYEGNRSCLMPYVIDGKVALRFANSPK